MVHNIIYKARTEIQPIHIYSATIDVKLLKHSQKLT